MEQLQEMDLTGLSAPECEKIEVCIEYEEKKIEPVRENKVHIIPLKSRLSKLMRKSRHNAKYIEQVIPIQRLERERIHRNYGIY